MIARRSEPSYCSGRVTNLVITWVMMIPLAYFAGGFWLQNARSTDATFLGYGVLASTPQPRDNAVTILVIFSIVFAAFLPKIRSILDACRANLIFVALAGFAIISCLWSQFPMKSVERSACLAVNTLFAFYLCRRFNSAQRLRLLYLFGWIAILLSVVLAILFPRYGRSMMGGQEVWQGIYPHRNICATMTLLLLPAPFYISPVTFLFRVGRAVYIGLSVFLILMSQSATGKVGLVCLLAYIGWLKIFKTFGSKDRAIVIVISITAAAALIFAGMSYASKIAYALGRDPTISGRADIWRFALVSIAKQPFLGYGYSAFWSGPQGGPSGAAAAGPLAFHAHNVLLEILLELGLAGLVLFLFSVVKAVRDALSCLRAGRADYIFWCECIFVLVIATNFDESGLIIAPHNLSWILYIVACVGLSEGAKNIRLRKGYE